MVNRVVSRLKDMNNGDSYFFERVPGASVVGGSRSLDLWMNCYQLPEPER